MKKKICLLLSLLMCAAGCAAKGESAPSEGGTASVEFLKVSKADSAIVRTEDISMMIDCGEKSDGKKICQHLDDTGVEKLDYLVLTHFDQDHIGGAARIIKKIEVSHIIAPSYTGDGKEYTELCDAMKLKGLDFENPSGVMELTGSDVQFSIYPSQKDDYSEGDDNNRSLVIKMKHHSNVFLFAGDAMEERLAEIMDIGDCDVLKAPYHGRKLDNLGEFLDKTTPEYAVISTDASTLSKKAEKDFTSRKITTFVTFRDGNILFTSDGNKIKAEKQ